MGKAAEDEDSTLGEALEKFHEHLLSNESVLALDNATLARWQERYDSSMAALSEQEKEPDMERINERIADLLRESNVPPFSNATHETILEYFTDLMYRAKL